MILTEQLLLTHPLALSHLDSSLSLSAFIVIVRYCNVNLILMQPRDRKMTHNKRPFVFLDVSINGDRAERMVFKLFYKVAPKIAENFRALCTGEKGYEPVSGKPLHCKGFIFHRIDENLAQAGDLSKQDGSGRESIYGKKSKGSGRESIYGKKSKDGSYRQPHDGPGYLSTSNTDSNSNGSQFFITFQAAYHLNSDNVVFGKLVQGRETLEKIKQVGSKQGKPQWPVQIVDCGEFDAKNEPSKLKSSGGRRKKRRRSDFDDDPVKSDSDSGSSYSSSSDTSSSHTSGARKQSPSVMKDAAPRRTLSKSPRARRRRSQSRSLTPRSVIRSSPRGRSRRSSTRSPVRPLSRIRRRSYSRSPGSPVRKGQSPVPSRGMSVPRPVSPEGSSKRIRKGRGFTPRYSFARRYLSQSPDRSPVILYSYGGRNNRDRYSSYRGYNDRSSRHYRSPLRGRTPQRYRSGRRRTRSLDSIKKPHSPSQLE